MRLPGMRLKTISSARFPDCGMSRYGYSARLDGSGPLGPASLANFQKQVLEMLIPFVRAGSAHLVLPLCSVNKLPSEQG